MTSRLRSVVVSPLIGLLILLIVLALSASAVSGHGGKPRGETVSVGDVSHVGTVSLGIDYMFAGTEVGGLSGIAYDRHRDVYYVLSDDRSDKAPSRYYTMDIEVVDGELQVAFLDVTFLRDKRGNLFARDAIDPESVELVTPGIMYISTEGDGRATPEIDPFISRFNPVGRQINTLPLPDKFLYSQDGNNLQNNLGFESLTSSPNDRYLYAATENALENDGPIATLENYSPSRFLQYDLHRRRPLAEYVYCVNPIPKAPDPPGAFADHGLVEIQALDNNGTFLTMERSYAQGVGNTILLFEASIAGATDVSDITALNLDGCPEEGIEPMAKEFITDFASLGVDPDNVEAMTFGPTLPDGSQLLIAVSDNNFNDFQTTQFIALSVELEGGH